MATKRTKLQSILRALTSDGTEIDFSEFDKSVNTLKSGLKKKIQIQTLEDVNTELDKFKTKINFTPIVESIDKIRESIDKKFEEITSEIDIRSNQLEVTRMASDKDAKNREKQLQTEIKDLQLQLSSLEEVRKTDVSKYTGNLDEFKKNYDEFETRMDEFFTYVASRLDVLETPEEKIDYLPIIEQEINKLRIEFFSKLAGLGGGSMNRQITLANTDILTKYTDINLKAGTNVTITASTNNTTKRTDITFAATGGSGTTRTITTLTVSSVIGTSTGDQVYLANGGIQITLPTAVSDTNLYTIKNVGTSSVLINTQNAETIDNDPTIIMPVRYTSVDLISDSANWNVT